MACLTKYWKISALVLVLALVVAACGGDDATATPRSATPQPTATLVRPTATVPATAAPSPTSPAGTAVPQATPTTAQATATPRPQATATPQATTGPREPAGTLNVALSSLGQETWIPRLSNGDERHAQNMFLEVLIGGDTKTRALKPLIATEWSVKVNAAETLWSFKIKPGVQFHQGQGEATAEDIKFSYGEYLKTDSVNAAAGQVRASVGNKIENFEVVGPYEFRIHSPSLDVTLLTIMSSLTPNVYMLSKKHYDSVGDKNFDAKPVGTGSFTVKEHVRANKVVMEAVPRHWRATPNVKTVNLLIVPEIASRVAMLKTGQSDMALMEKRFIAELTPPRLKAIPVKDQAVVFVVLGGMFPDLPDKNCTKCPWVGTGGNALKVRQALSLAIDRKAIIDKLLYGQGQIAPAPFMWPPGPYAFTDPNWPLPTYNKDRAKQLLAEAGYPNGFSVDFPIVTTSVYPENPDTSEAVAGFWEAIGITVKRMPMEFSPTLRQKMADRTTGGMAWVLANQFTDEPSRTLRNLFTKTAVLGYLHDPKIDEIVPKAVAEPDINKRRALDREIGGYFVEQLLAIPMFSSHGVWGVSSKVTAWDNLTAYPALNNVESVTLAQ